MTFVGILGCRSCFTFDHRIWDFNSSTLPRTCTNGNTFCFYPTRRLLVFFVSVSSIIKITFIIQQRTSNYNSAPCAVGRIWLLIFLFPSHSIEWSASSNCRATSLSPNVRWQIKRLPNCFVVRPTKEEKTKRKAQTNYWKIKTNFTCSFARSWRGMSRVVASKRL